MSKLLFTKNNNHHGNVAIYCAPLRGHIYVSQEHNGQHVNTDFPLSQVKSVSAHNLQGTFLGTNIKIKGRAEPVLLKGIDPTAVEKTFEQARKLHRKAIHKLNPLTLCEKVGGATLDIFSLLQVAGKTAVDHASGTSQKKAKATRSALLNRLRWQRLDL